MHAACTYTNAEILSILRRHMVREMDRGASLDEAAASAGQQFGVDQDRVLHLVLPHPIATQEA